MQHLPRPVFNSARAIPSVQETSPVGDIKNRLTTALEGFVRNWKETSGSLETLSHRVPESFNALFELQKGMHRVQLQSSMVVKGGEALSSTLRRVQQMGQ